MTRFRAPGKAAVHTHGRIGLHLIFGLPDACVVGVVHVFVVVQVAGVSLETVPGWMFTLTRGQCRSKSHPFAPRETVW